MRGGRMDGFAALTGRLRFKQPTSAFNHIRARYIRRPVVVADVETQIATSAVLMA